MELSTYICPVFVIYLCLEGNKLNCGGNSLSETLNTYEANVFVHLHIYWWSLATLCNLPCHEKLVHMRQRKSTKY